MAAEKHSSTRRRVLGAAVALPVLALAGFPACAEGTVPERGLSPSPSPAQTLWTRRLARYRRLHAAWKAEAETGAFRAANDRYERKKAAIEARFGSWAAALASRRARPGMRAAYERVSAAEDLYYHRYTAPMYRAMTRLVHTAAPDLPALLAKIEIIREHEPDLFDDAPLRSFEMLRKDVERLARSGCA
jgi:hypothetical protein